MQAILRFTLVLFALIAGGLTLGRVLDLVPHEQFLEALIRGGAAVAVFGAVALAVRGLAVR
ncbi:MAG: hypothetical protein ACYTGN_00055 [Planctomycetota bacterium]|jgi:hypothetical protein